MFLLTYKPFDILASFIKNINYSYQSLIVEIYTLKYKNWSNRKKSSDSNKTSYEIFFRSNM